ncbi:MAG: SH3 domain-containing protein [Serpentinimonas sp.]|nr:SH3 domain-containing protein [Serpentinimonas sp.]
MFMPAAAKSLALSLLLAVAAVLPAWAQEMVSVRGNTVNMRSGPGTNHEVLWELARGYPLQVKERRNGWLNVVDFEGDEGWVAQQVVTNTPHHIVKGRVVNLRAGPGTNHRVVGKADYGEVLPTLARQGDWVRVRAPNGGIAWVSRSLLWGW